MKTVRSFIYLGVKFHISDSSTEAKHNLYTRGLKAYFELCKAFSNVKPNIISFFHVLDLVQYGDSLQITKKNHESSAEDFFQIMLLLFL